jgi:hypothetical protein
MSDGFKTIYVVHRRIELQLGDVSMLAVAAFEDEKSARRAAEGRDAALKDIINFAVVDNGNSKISSVMDVISSIGISAITHGIMTVKVKEASVIVGVGGNVVPIGGSGIVRG